jgi:hypothetical protein
MLVWTPATAATIEIDAGDNAATARALSSDGTRIVMISTGGTVTIQDVDGAFRTRLRLPGATCVAWVGTTIAVGRRTGPVVLELREPD